MTDAAAVAAWGLPTAHRLPDRAVTDDAFGALLASCEQQRVLGLLGLAVRDGAFPVTEPQHEQLDPVWQGWLGHALRVERLATRVVAGLDDAGIPTRILKGMALAHTSYPDPAARVFGDVDVLVPADRLHRAAAVVVDLGGRRAEPEVRPGFDDRFGREAMVRLDQVEIDLHRTFVNGAFGVRIDLAGLFATPVTVPIGATTVAVLPPVARLLHAAYASTLSDWPPRLVAIRDLAQVLLHDAPEPEAVVDTAARWRGTAVLAAAVVQAWRTLRLTERHPLLEWAERTRPGPIDRLWIAGARGRARGYTAGLTTFAVTPGVRGRSAYLQAVLWPSRDYRDARGLGRFALVGAGATRARRG